jgi:hypothetical protein
MGTVALPAPSAVVACIAFIIPARIFITVFLVEYNMATV